MFRFDRSVCILLAIWNLLWIGMLVATPSIAKAEPAWYIPRAQAIAATVWRGGPCAGHVTVKWSSAVLTSDTLPAATAGWVAPTTEPCVVRLNVDNPAAPMWDVLCPVMIHEYGHLVGMQHSTNPNSVMFPSPGPDARCDERGRTYLEAHHAAP